jgi:hypothetical protein
MVLLLEAYQDIWYAFIFVQNEVEHMRVTGVESRGKMCSWVWIVRVH